jgi:glycosyltransferase involved in cell wall biosynthesis
MQDKFGILTNIPLYWRTFAKELNSADIVHVRCPANLSLIALLQMSLRRKPKKRWIKYAGNWYNEAVQPLTYRFQQHWLKRNWVRGTVTINGQSDLEHIVSFENPCLTEAEICRGVEVAQEKQITRPVRLLFVGRVERHKGFHRVIGILASLIESGVETQLDVVGDSDEGAAFQDQLKQQKLDAFVTFHGWIPKGALVTYYERAHFLLLPSESEGWPKVVSEAVAYGTIPLTSDISILRKVFEQTGTGFAFPADETDKFTQAIIDLSLDKERYTKMKASGAALATRFTYDYYLDAVSQLPSLS